jgi:glutathione synthase
VRLAFVIDPLSKLDPCHDTSVALMEAAQRLGGELWVARPRDLALDHGNAVAWARPVTIEPAVQVDGRWIAADRWFELGPPELIFLSDVDAVLMRADPPVEQAYMYATFVLDAAARTGTLVVNDPTGLRIVNEKLLPTLIPDLGPATLVSARGDHIREALRRWGLAVAKPLDGMAGRGVVMLRDGDRGLEALIELVTDAGRRQIVVQEYLPAACDGDKRILLIGGDPVGAINRCSRPGEFRCNMAVGAAVRPTTLDDRDVEIIERLKPLLRARGLHFAGIDVIGGRLTEVNITSPTGIREAELLGHADAAVRVAEWIAQRVDGPGIEGCGSWRSLSAS